jgi:hypothetical protein
MRNEIASALSVIFGLGGLLCWFFMVINGTRLWWHFKPDTPARLWPRPSEMLTEKGLAIWWWARLGLIGFFIGWFASYAFGILAR